MNKLKSQIPNMITVTRIISSILAIIFFIKGKVWISVALYIYGAISDGADGYLARKYALVSKTGQYLDAVSDKLYTLSIIILGIVYKNYLMLIPLLFEVYIAIINYVALNKNKKVYTERVGKFKTVVLFISMILGLISTKVKFVYYIFVPFLILTIYFQIQSVFAYHNQLNMKSKEVVVNFKGKNTLEKIGLLLKEFIYYLCNPVRIIK